MAFVAVKSVFKKIFLAKSDVMFNVRIKDTKGCVLMKNKEKTTLV